MAIFRDNPGMAATASRRLKGKEAENIACDYLKGMDVQILCRNYRTRYGEIDIVGMEKDVLVFYEVKSTSNNRFLSAPIEAVTSRKAATIRNVARAYMAINRYHEHECRFDVVSIYNQGSSSTGVDLMKDAF